jgi:hypothetical protein
VECRVAALGAGGGDNIVLSGAAILADHELQVRAFLSKPG